MTTHRRRFVAAMALASLLILRPEDGFAQTRQGLPPAPPVTYADMVDLADSARLVLRAKIRKMIRVADERAPGLKRGHGRFYIEGETQALLTGTSPLGESLAYLVDLPLDSKGKPPKLKKQDVLLFARPVAGQPGELQLVAPDAQLLWSETAEAQLRRIIGDLISPDAPGRISGVREIIHVPGTLAGEGETQIFLATQDGSPASITVSHRPGLPPAWGASFSELVADVGRPPVRGTLEWYRLACFLPNNFRSDANLSETPSSRAQAVADYRMVLGALGACDRNRR
jgi:hypothetical protein